MLQLLTEYHAITQGVFESYWENLGGSWGVAALTRADEEVAPVADPGEPLPPAPPALACLKSDLRVLTWTIQVLLMCHLIRHMPQLVPRHQWKGGHQTRLA